MKTKFKFLAFLLILIVAFVFVGCSKDPTPDPTPDPDKEKSGAIKDDEKLVSELTDLSVRDYVGENGVVAAANPFAAYAGLLALESGGNAFDAAVAISFALGVVEPNASGIGGGGIMVAYDAEAGEYVSYNFREFVPAAGVATAFPHQKDDLSYGPLAPGVPTQVAGLLTVLDERGKLDRQTVMAPAISLAKDGVPVTPELSKSINDNQGVIMKAKKEAQKVFLNENLEPLNVGELLVQENYGKVLQEIADKGKDGFYKGWVAEAILASCGTAAGGLMTQADLDYAVENYPKRPQPLTGTYHGYDIVTANTPSSGGIILIEALNMLEVYGNVGKLQHNSAEYINVVSTALQLAYGDKRKYIGDSDMERVPITGLCSKLYAAERWEKFTEGQAYLGRFAGDNDYGDPWPYCSTKENLSADYKNVDGDEHFSTTSFSVADKAGNIVSVTQTINHFYGCGIIPAGCGFYLNNQLTSFSFSSTSVNFMKPLKQPVSHIMPTIIMKDGEPFATLGSPGSMRIPSAVAEVVLNLIDFGMSIQDAIAAPRFYSYACSNDDGSTTSKDIFVENAIPVEVRDKLIMMNYNVRTDESGSTPIHLYFGGVQGITFNIKDGKVSLHGGADPRRDGKALGY